MEFFQLDTQGGIFQSSISYPVTFLGGECITVFGGDPVDPAIFLALNPPGFKGSSYTVYILMILYLAVLFVDNP